MKKAYKNQIVIYVIAFMLVAAGYLNYAEKNIVEVNSNEEQIQQEVEGEIAKENDTRSDENIGDATLVNSDTKEIQDVVEKEDDYYSSSKLEREKTYSQMIESYQKMLDNPNVSEEQKAIVTQEIKKINDNKGKIMVCEKLITTKGFEDVVIFINDDSINVVVKFEKLTTEQVAQIQNIVMRETNVGIENIHIMSH